MDKELMTALVEQLKASGLDEDKIMGVFYETFKEGKMGRDDLEVLAEFMGYELTDDFKNDEHAEPIEGGEVEGGEISKEELEEAKEIKPGESKEEFKEKIDEMKSEGGEPEGKVEEKEEDKVEEKKDEDEVESKSEEDAEWEEAQKLFK